MVKGTKLSSREKVWIEDRSKSIKLYLVYVIIFLLATVYTLYSTIEHGIKGMISPYKEYYFMLFVCFIFSLGFYVETKKFLTIIEKLKRNQSSQD